MKPITKLYPVAKWFLKISLVLLIFFKTIERIKNLNYSDIDFYISCIFLISSFLIIIGGLIRKHGLTVISSIIVSLIAIYKLILVLNIGVTVSATIYIVITGVGILFVSKGNE